MAKKEKAMYIKKILAEEKFGEDLLFYTKKTERKISKNQKNKTLIKS